MNKLCNFFLVHLLPLAQVLVFHKVDRGGEDAFFVSNYSGGVIAVADGVSGYATQLSFSVSGSFLMEKLHSLNQIIIIIIILLYC